MRLRPRNNLGRATLVPSQQRHIPVPRDFTQLLPLELLTQIVDGVDETAIPQLRLTNKIFCGLATPRFAKEEFSYIRVKNTLHSLDSLVKVTAHSTFANYVREIRVEVLEYRKELGELFFNRIAEEEQSSGGHFWGISPIDDEENEHALRRIKDKNNVANHGGELHFLAAALGNLAQRDISVILGTYAEELLFRRLAQPRYSTAVVALVKAAATAGFPMRILDLEYVDSNPIHVDCDTLTESDLVYMKQAFGYLREFNLSNSQEHLELDESVFTMVALRPLFEVAVNLKTITMWLWGNLFMLRDSLSMALPSLHKISLGAVMLAAPELIEFFVNHKGTLRDVSLDTVHLDDRVEGTWSVVLTTVEGVMSLERLALSYLHSVAPRHSYIRLSNEEPDCKSRDWCAEGAEEVKEGLGEVVAFLKSHGD